MDHTSTSLYDEEEGGLFQAAIAINARPLMVESEQPCPFKIWMLTSPLLQSMPRRAKIQCHNYALVNKSLFLRCTLIAGGVAEDCNLHLVIGFLRSTHLVLTVSYIV